MKIMKLIFSQTSSKPRIIVHTIFLVALPNEMNQSASLAIVELSGMEGGQFQIYSIQLIEIVWGATIPPPRSWMPRPSANLPL